MRTLLALALTAGAFTAMPAFAQQDQEQMPPPPPGAMQGGHHGGGMGGMGLAGMLLRADANHDGIVTREEVIASSDQMFDRLDTNHDGIVTPDEMRAGREAMRPMGAQPRGDVAPPPPSATAGSTPMGLTREQWHDRALRQFDRVDANHDGRVDRTEIANYQEAMRVRRMERRGGGDTSPPPGAPAMAPAPQQ